MTIEILRDPPEDVAKALSDGIISFNSRSVPDLEPNEAETRFHAVSRDDAGELNGGLRASCYWNTLHIELLWLAEQSRGTGIGRRLLAAAERFAVEQGCELALVETTSWQARPFYEKNGYDLMATLEGRPKGHASYYLRKTLSAKAR